MSQLISLCRAVIEDYFGPIVATVGEALLREAGPLAIIISRLKEKVTLPQIRRAIVVLEQHHLLTFTLVNAQRVYYRINPWDVVNLLRIPRCGQVIKSLYADAGEAIYEELIGEGRTTMNSLLQKVQGRELGIPVTEVYKKFCALAAANFIIKEAPVECVVRGCPSFSTTYDQFTVPELKLANFNDGSRKRKASVSGDDESIYWKINWNRFEKYLRDELIIELLAGPHSSSTEHQERRSTILALLKTNEARATPQQILETLPISLTDIVTTAKDSGIADLDRRSAESALLSMCETANGVLRKVGDSAGGLYTIDYSLGMRQLAQSHVESLIREQLDTKAVRIFRLLQRHRYLEEEQIEKMVMLSSKETRELLYAMNEENYVFVQPLGKTSDFAPARTFYLYNFDLDRTVRLVEEGTCKFLLNLISRRKHEEKQHSVLLERNRRMEAILAGLEENTSEQQKAEIVQIYLSEGDRTTLEKYKNGQKMLMASEVEIERVLFVLHSHLGFSKRRAPEMNSSSTDLVPDDYAYRQIGIDPEQEFNFDQDNVEWMQPLFLSVIAANVEKPDGVDAGAFFGMFSQITGLACTASDIPVCFPGCNTIPEAIGAYLDDYVHFHESFGLFKLKAVPNDRGGDWKFILVMLEEQRKREEMRISKKAARNYEPEKRRIYMENFNALHAIMSEINARQHRPPNSPIPFADLRIAYDKVGQCLNAKYMTEHFGRSSFKKLVLDNTNSLFSSRLEYIESPRGGGLFDLAIKKGVQPFTEAEIAVTIEAAIQDKTNLLRSKKEHITDFNKKRQENRPAGKPVATRPEVPKSELPAPILDIIKGTVRQPTEMPRVVQPREESSTDDDDNAYTDDEEDRKQRVERSRANQSTRQDVSFPAPSRAPLRPQEIGRNVWDDPRADSPTMDLQQLRILFFPPDQNAAEYVQPRASDPHGQSTHDESAQPSSHFAARDANTVAGFNPNGRADFNPTMGAPSYQSETKQATQDSHFGARFNSNDRAGFNPVMGAQSYQSENKQAAQVSHFGARNNNPVVGFPSNDQPQLNATFSGSSYQPESVPAAQPSQFGAIRFNPNPVAGFSDDRLQFNTNSGPSYQQVNIPATQPSTFGARNHNTMAGYSSNERPQFNTTMPSHQSENHFATQQPQQQQSISRNNVDPHGRSMPNFQPSMPSYPEERRGMSAFDKPPQRNGGQLEFNQYEGAAQAMQSNQSFSTQSIQNPRGQFAMGSSSGSQPAYSRSESRQDVFHGSGSSGNTTRRGQGFSETPQPAVHGFVAREAGIQTDNDFFDEFGRFETFNSKEALAEVIYNLLVYREREKESLRLCKVEEIMNVLLMKPLSHYGHNNWASFITFECGNRIKLNPVGSPANDFLLTLWN
ncbi:unnamed protein product, partial [Mesorhabditis spiculigera]